MFNSFKDKYFQRICDKTEGTQNVNLFRVFWNLKVFFDRIYEH